MTAAIPLPVRQNTPEARCRCGAPKKRTSITCLECYRAGGMRSESRPPLVRLWENLDTSGGLFACWPWRGLLDANGYGRFFYRGRPRWAHRVAYELLVGPIPQGREIRHLVCDNPPCCNPAHLATGTHQQNVADSVSKRRHTFGERNGAARLTTPQVQAIRAELATGRLHRLIAADFGVSRTLIDMIGRGERWAHVA